MQTLYWIVGVYLTVCVAGYLVNRQFMYFPNPYRVSPQDVELSGIEEVELTTPDDITLVTWQAKAKPGKPTLLYFHGNGANAAARAGKFQRIADTGYGLLYLNNRGYGGSQGSPSEAKNVADALLAYEHLIESGVKPEDIVVYGESLGTGQAVRLGSERKVRAVVLEAPLTSTVDVGSQTYFFLPLKLILTDQYRNEDNVPNVKAPLLVLHGEQDEVIPVNMGKRVFKAANEPKELALFPHGTHSDLFDHGAWEKAVEFAERY